MSSSTDQEDFQQDDSSEEEEVLSGEAGAVDEDTEDEGESEAGVSEAEDLDDENNSEAKQPALDASSTESDEDNEDDEVDDDEDIPTKKSAAIPKTERFAQALKEKYEKRQGKQLFIRFPEKLPVDQDEFDKKVKAISELIVKANKPRQKHARFCLVDFANTQDRDETMKKLKKHKAENKLEVSLPKTESEEFIKKLTEMKKKKIEKKRAKQLLKKEEKKAPHGKNYTSTIVVLNIPKTASTTQIKELFPNAVDIQIKPAPSRFDGFSIATITLPSTLEASKNCKRNLSLGGTKLIIRFNNERKKNKIKNRKAKKNKQQTEERKGPVAPTSLVSNGDKQKTQKKGNKANKVKPPKDETSSPSKQKLPLSKKRESKNDDESKVSKKKAKLTKKPKQPTVESKDPVTPKKEKKNGKLSQEKRNAPPNKKVHGKKPNKQFKQKAKPQKKGKLAAK